jgi:hypothetical protein
MNRNLKKKLSQIETKMRHILSFENIIKLTKKVKIMNTFLFQDYQNKFFKFCPAPKQLYNKKTNLSTLLTKFDTENPIDQKILHFIETFKERFDWNEFA